MPQYFLQVNCYFCRTTNSSCQCQSNEALTVICVNSIQI